VFLPVVTPQRAQLLVLHFAFIAPPRSLAVAVVVRGAAVLQFVSSQFFVITELLTASERIAAERRQIVFIPNVAEEVGPPRKGLTAMFAVELCGGRWSLLWCARSSELNLNLRPH